MVALLKAAVVGAIAGAFFGFLKWLKQEAGDGNNDDMGDNDLEPMGDNVGQVGLDYDSDQSDGSVEDFHGEPDSISW
jgi:hypothetical protein